MGLVGTPLLFLLGQHFVMARENRQGIAHGVTLLLEGRLVVLELKKFFLVPVRTSRVPSQLLLA